MAFWARLLPWNRQFVRAGVRSMRTAKGGRTAYAQGSRRELRRQRGGQEHGSRPGERRADCHGTRHGNKKGIGTGENAWGMQSEDLAVKRSRERG